MTVSRVSFDKVYLTGNERARVLEAISSGRLAGDGPYSRRCHAWLEEHSRCVKALLTHSCTAALEMSAILLNFRPGDEVIVPSFTFVSTANAFVLQGAVPVFVDIREDTMNLDEQLLEQAITSRTRAIVVVHYAGVACEMDTILAIAEKHGIPVVEDAAQGVQAFYKNRPLGSLGALGAYSFHETKNIACGEGGSLLVNDGQLVQRAEIVREKGTDRSRFLRDEIDKYTWQEAGSSFLPGELTAAFLWAQLEQAETITQRRMECWERYHTLLKPLEEKGLLRRPRIPTECQHNAHIYYVLVGENIEHRQQVLDALRDDGIGAVFHYVPLHTANAGLRYGRLGSALDVTERQADRLLRLPLWPDLKSADQARVAYSLELALGRL